MDALGEGVPLQAAGAVGLEGHDDLAVEYARREQAGEGLHELGEVPRERFVAAASDLDTAVLLRRGRDLHDAAEAVPLGFVEKVAFGHLLDGFREHRRWQVAHPPILPPVASNA